MLLPTLLLIAAALPAQDVPTLRVLRQGDVVWVRSSFSPGHDLVVLIGKGANRQVNFDKVFVSPAKPGASMKDLGGATLVSGNTDESTPWHVTGTYIGANHGCSDARILTSARHGLDRADLGGEWTDEAGTRFYLMKIPDGDHLWVLSENRGDVDRWRFTGDVKGSRLRRSRDGAKLDFTAVDMVQLLPACRIRRQEILADGTRPVPEGASTECRTLDVVEEFDVINPGSVLRDVLAHPGQERDFAGPGLDAVIANRIVYRFLPGGATVIHHRAEAKQDFALGSMGFVQAAPLPAAVRHYYIPKTLPFTENGRDWDFERIQPLASAPPRPLAFSTEHRNVADPKDPPDRIVQLLGRQAEGRTVYDLGFAVGYSLIRGMTVPAKRSASAGTPLVLYSSAKSYPRAIDASLVRAGTPFDCVAYRQFFWPAAFPNASSCYWHPEGDETVLYLSYHRAVERDKIRLPAEFAGRTLRVVERTPSLTLHTEGAVPADGLVVSSSGRHGFLVVAIR